MAKSADDWRQIIRSEYLEFPDLRLTRSEIQRMWMLDDATCDALLKEFVEERFLRVTRDRRYTRVDVGLESI
jgi:hypothetical protein